MYAHLSKYYNQIFPHNPEIKNMIKSLMKGKGNALDIGCGTGRLAHDLCDLGMHVIGIDLDQDMIEVAMSHYPMIDFRVLNMLDIKQLNQTFDVMTCFGNTLPHIDNISLEKWFIDVYDLLNDEGILIIQLLNYQRILKHNIKALPIIEKDEFRFLRTYHYQKDTILFETEFIYQDQSFKGQETLYPYTLQDLTIYMKESTFELEAYGSPLLKPFDDEDYYVYMILRKRCL